MVAIARAWHRNQDEMMGGKLVGNTANKAKKAREFEHTKSQGCEDERTRGSEYAKMRGREDTRTERLANARTQG